MAVAAARTHMLLSACAPSPQAHSCCSCLDNVCLYKHMYVCHAGACWYLFVCGCDRHAGSLLGIKTFEYALLLVQLAVGALVFYVQVRTDST